MHRVLIFSLGGRGAPGLSDSIQVRHLARLKLAATAVVMVMAMARESVVLRSTEHLDVARLWHGSASLVNLQVVTSLCLSTPRRMVVLARPGGDKRSPGCGTIVEAVDEDVGWPDSGRS